MKKDINPLKKLSESTRKKILEEVLKTFKSKMVNLISNSNIEEICEFIKGSKIGDGMLSKTEIMELTKESENSEMREAIYDIRVNAAAMILKSKSKAELYETFSEADDKIYKEIMEE